MKKTRIMYIDGMNMFIRNFASLPLTNDQGAHIGALYGCLQSFRMLINEFKPDMFIFVWEGKGSSEKRRAILNEYKEGRKFSGFNRIFEGSPEEEKKAFSNQLKLLREYIKLLPFYQASIDYLEADDVIAYMTEQMFDDKDQFENLIISTDRDYYQLVDNNTFIFRPVKTKKNKKGQFITTQKVIEETGVHPKNYIISKCVAGDSDNIDGIPRVGAKTVAKDFAFLESLKSNGDIYNINDIIDFCKKELETNKSKKYEKYLGHRELLERNYQLIQLLDPDISLQSIRSIERIFTNYTPAYEKTSFRLALIRDSISPKNVLSWVDAFTNIHPKKISFE